MSQLLASRGHITAALEAGGIRWSTTGTFAAPAVLVEPGEPWAEPHTLGHGRRNGRWRLTAVAGKADTEGAVETLADLIDAVDGALWKLPNVELPTWSMPRDVLLGNVPYAASIGTIQYMTEEV
jgi:hypothetical protein